MARRTRRNDGAIKLIRSFIPNAVTLDQFLITRLPFEQQSLIRAERDTGFLRLLRRTIVAHSVALPSFLYDPNLTSMSDVIMRVIERILNKTRFVRHPTNVLSLGFRPASEGAQTTFGGVENFYPNTLISHLKEAAWESLLKIIGDVEMGVLLEHCSLFVQIKAGGTYLQVTGAPISEIQNVEPNTKSERLVILRHKILYARPPKNGGKNFSLLPTNILADCSKIDKLTRRMFYRNAPNVKMDDAKWNSFRSIAKYVFKKQKSCPYRSIFDYYTKSECFDEGEFLTQSDCDPGNVEPSSSVDSVKSEGILSFATKLYAVRRILMTCLRKVLPKGIIQNHPFMRSIDRNIETLVKLRKNESMSVSEIISGLGSAGSSWLPSVSRSKDSQQELRKNFESFIYWIFDGYCIPLIRSLFYVTDSTAYRERLFYFPHQIWSMKSEYFLAELKVKMFHPIPLKPNNNTGWDQLGTCNLRLIPKGSSFRPVMNLRKRIPRQGTTIGASINGLLKNVHQVLSYAAKAHPALLGCSVLGLDEIARRIGKFMRTHSVDSVPLYFVKIDFKACFDSIPHQKLLQVLAHEVLPKGDFNIHKYDVIKSIHGRTWKMYKKFASPTSDFVGLSGHFSSKPQNKSPRILIDKVVGIHTDRRRIFKLLEEHITKNLVYIDGQLFEQKVGIPQGSILSSLLCSFLYGDMDRVYLSKFISDPESLALRFIDDMIFVTTTYSKASDFIQSVIEGFEEYGVQINLDKVAANFFHPQIPQKIPAKDTFPWCGLLLDQETLEVLGDYSKMFGAYIKDSLTVQRVNKPVEAFIRQVKIFLKPKLKPIFLDATINSKLIVTMNIYQNFVYVAIKTHVYLRELRRGGIAHVRPDLLLLAIEEAYEFAVCLLRSTNRKYDVPVKWLGVRAFKKVFERKPTVYRGLVLDELVSLGIRLQPPRPWAIDFDKVFSTDDVLMKNILH